MEIVSVPSLPASHIQKSSISPSVTASAYENGDGVADLYTPFRDALSPGDEISEDGACSYAESHRVHRGWIAECLWWLASCRRPRYQSDYVVLFLNESERFGSNSCRLSGICQRLFVARSLHRLFAFAFYHPSFCVF